MELDQRCHTKASAQMMELDATRDECSGSCEPSLEPIGRHRAGNYPGLRYRKLGMLIEHLETRTYEMQAVWCRYFGFFYPLSLEVSSTGQPFFRRLEPWSWDCDFARSSSILAQHGQENPSEFLFREPQGCRASKVG